MLDYSTIDPELFRWASEKGYTVQTRYRDDVVRAFEIWSNDNQKKSEILISESTLLFIKSPPFMLDLITLKEN